MSILYFFEKIRNPVLDVFMQLVTELGSETCFLVVALVIYWCIDKRRGYYLMAVGFLGTIINQFMKLFFRIPRPWVKDPQFTIVESARADATGYSFPSGHSQTAVGNFGVIAVTAKRKWVRYLAVFFMVLVPVSRMYLGVHTLADVAVGSLCALVLITALRPVVYSRKKWAIPALMVFMILCGLGFLAYTELAAFPADIDTVNLAHAQKNAYTLLGSMAGFLLGYVIEVKRVNFRVDAVWWAQGLKIVLGLGIAVALKAGLKAPLMALFGGHNLAHFVRYFVVVLFAALLWPLTFCFFSKLGGNKR